MTTCATVLKHLVCALCVWAGSAQLSVQVQNTAVFRPDYKYFPETRGWIKFHKIPSTWLEARLKCYYEGAVLASPLDEHLYVAMRSFMLSGNRSAFMGLQTLTGTGDYFSIEGVRLDDMSLSWAAGEPDNAGDQERCLAMAPGGGAADVRCGDVLPYMCYRRRTGLEALTECGTHDKEYVMDEPGGSCHKFHAACASWWRAGAVCAAERGRLASLASEAQTRRLLARFSNNTAACADRMTHIGFTNLAFDRHLWFTLDGKRLEESGYGQWAANEPNAVPGVENCGAISWDDGRLADVSCDRVLSFLCEISPQNNNQ